MSNDKEKTRAMFSFFVICDTKGIKSKISLWVKDEKGAENVNYKNIEKKRLDVEQYVLLMLRATKLEISVCRERVENIEYFPSTFIALSCVVIKREKNSIHRRKRIFVHANTCTATTATYVRFRRFGRQSVPQTTGNAQLLRRACIVDRR